MTDKEQYLKDLFEDLKYSLSKFDSQSLAISSGALGLSLTFIKDIVPFKESHYICLFYFALILFIFNLTLGFIGHFLSLNQISNAIEKVQNDKISEIKQDKIVPKINLLIVITLPLGILFLVFYCILNIENVRIKNDNINTSKVQIENKIKNIDSVKNKEIIDSINKKTIIKK